MNLPQLAIQMSASKKDHLILARLASGKTTMAEQKPNLDQSLEEEKESSDPGWLQQKKGSEIF